MDRWSINKEFVMSRVFRVGVVIAILMGVLGLSVASKVSAAPSPHSSTLHAANYAAFPHGVLPKVSNRWGPIVHPQLPNNAGCGVLYLAWKASVRLYGWQSTQAVDALTAYVTYCGE